MMTANEVDKARELHFKTCRCKNPCEGNAIGSVARCFKCGNDIFTWEDFNTCGSQGNLFHDWMLVYCFKCSGRGSQKEPLEELEAIDWYVRNRKKERPTAYFFEWWWTRDGKSLAMNQDGKRIAELAWDAAIIRCARSLPECNGDV